MTRGFLVAFLLSFGPAVSNSFARFAYALVLPAMRTDQVVLRAFLRNLNLLTPPEMLMKDPEVGARVLAAWQDRENRVTEPALGPARRDDLLASLAA